MDQNSDCSNPSGSPSDLESPVHKDRSRKTARHSRNLWLTLLRVLVSVALLWFLLRQSTVSEITGPLRRSLGQWPFLLLALLLPVFGVLTASLRWGVLLAAHGAKVPVLALAEAFLVGNFYNQFFPSTIAGDVVRSWWVVKPSGSTTSDATLLNLVVVGLDRAMGVLGMCTLALVAALASPHIARQVPQVWIILVLVALGTLAVIALSGQPRRAVGRWLLSIQFLRRVRDKSGMIYEALISYRQQKWRLLSAVMLSIGLQLLIVIQYWALAAALGIDLSIQELAIIIPMVNLISLVPVTINGIGLRENALAVLGASLGLGTADALALAWSFLAVTLVYAAFGGMVHMRGRHRWDRSRSAQEPSLRAERCGVTEKPTDFHL